LSLRGDPGAVFNQSGYRPTRKMWQVLLLDDARQYFGIELCSSLISLYRGVEIGENLEQV